jgi:hypothetical protein
MRGGYIVSTPFLYPIITSTNYDFWARAQKNNAIKYYNMKLSNKYISLLTLLLFSIFSNAQTLEEAVRYSYAENIGTARMVGAGGAFGALGGELGSVMINPATAGTYVKGEFAIAPMSLSSVTTTEFQNNPITDDNANNLHLFNMGAVFSNYKQGNKWETTNFIISYNKISDFNQSFSFSGISEGTIVERFAERANGLTLDQLDDFEAGVAFDSGAIFDFDNDLNYDFDAFPDQELGRSQFARYTGGISELSFTLGGTYEKQLQLGISLNIPILNFSSTKTYEEVAPDERSAFRNLSYTETLNTTGNGLNFRAGAIFTGLKPLRIGLSVTSPTNFNLQDVYSTEMTYTFFNVNTSSNETFSTSSPEGEFDYNFSTPWKYTGSIAYLLKGAAIDGFVSADIDYLNYRGSSFNLTTEGNTETALETDLNNLINQELKSAVNIRLGSEIAYDIYRFRLGCNFNSSPYWLDSNFFGGLSGGFGLRFDKFYFDLGARRQNFQQGYIPYNSLNEDNVQLVQLNTRKTYLVSTFGIKF